MSFGRLLFQTRYRCAGYSGGKSAIDHAADGLFDDAAVTKWRRGSAAEVVRRGTVRAHWGWLEV